MKKTAFILCCLAGILMLTPKELRAWFNDRCIDVTKSCTDAVEPGDPIPFSGTVTNCGTDVVQVLENVTVVDDNGTPADPSDDFTVFGATYLAAGASATFSGSYLPATSPSTNTVTATGHYLASGIVTATASATCSQPEESAGCRVTGGGNDTAGLGIDGLWDGTFASDKLRMGAGEYNRYTFGGQAGANTALQPQPKGEWTHHQQDGYDGDFVFHAGTASAPPGTEIATIVCSDENGPCSPAGLSPFKQIDFEGVGSFKNIKNPSPKLAGVVPGETYHQFYVHIEDLGEPGTQGNKKNSGAICPQGGSGTDAFASLFAVADCRCADFYRIRILGGVAPVFDPTTGELTNLAEIKSQQLIYEVSGYLDGGNLQIHPLTGFDR